MDHLKMWVRHTIIIEGPSEANYPRAPLIFFTIQSDSRGMLTLKLSETDVIGLSPKLS